VQFILYILNHIKLLVSWTYRSIHLIRIWTQCIINSYFETEKRLSNNLFSL